MVEIIRNLDWVKERSECSIMKVFETLKLQVKEDMEQRNKLLPSGSHYNFIMTQHDNAFVVMSQSNEKNKGVAFELVGSVIQVNDRNGNEKFSATLTLNDDGECKVKIRDQERELWQMRRAALEDLFFNTF